MKNLLTAFLSFTLFSCFPVQSQNTIIDIVRTNTFSFKKIATGNTISLSATAAEITAAFGSPVSTTEVVSELDDLTYTKWTYSGIKISLITGKLSSLEISITSIGLVFYGTTIKVGSDINNLSSLFPGSFALRSDERMLMFIGLHHNDQITDAHIVIGFNGQDKITTISLVN